MKTMTLMFGIMLAVVTLAGCAGTQKPADTTGGYKAVPAHDYKGERS